MPRKAKDKEKNEEKVNKKVAEKKEAQKKSTTKKVASKTSAEKKPAVKKTATAKKTSEKKSTTKKATAKKATTKKTTAKKATAKKSTTKKAETKKTTTTKKAVSKKVPTKRASTKTSSKKAKKETVTVVEYYDLPFRYDETVVKVLAQNPETLFIYWDISDEDKQNYIKKYGEFFFNDTKPVLVVHNDTLKYSFEIDINDFANSWYLNVKDSNCDYRVELGRRPINEYSRINDYMQITSSNEMDVPNDHILFDSLGNNVFFKNYKTNVVSKIDISLYYLSRLGKLYNIKDFYKAMYKDEDIDFEKLNFRNMPSS